MKNLVKISILAAGLFAFASCNNEAKKEETATADSITVTPTEPQAEETPVAPDTNATAQPQDTTTTEEHAH